MKLNKFIAQSGYCSRRKADELIINKKVKVNGLIVDKLGFVINDNKDRVEIDNKEIKSESEKIYLAINKPKGYLSSNKTWQGKSVLELINNNKKIYPVGRLDKDSSGLLILTNDGDFAYKLTQAKFNHEKEYEVIFNKPLKKEDIKIFESGMVIDNQKIQPIKVINNRANKANLILKEGINRQIRKMAKARGYLVTDLKRVRVGKLRLNSLKLGEYKAIKPKEVI